MTKPTSEYIVSEFDYPLVLDTTGFESTKV